MTYSSEVLADSPLAYYRLGDASGTTMTDSSGNGRNGTYSGSPTLGATGLLVGDANTCVDLDGVNDMATVAYDSAWMAPASFTVEAIIRLDTLPAAGTNATIITRWEGSTGNRPWVFSVFNGTLRFFDQSGDVRGGTTLSAGVTYHVAAAYSGGNVTIYLNGAVDANSAIGAPLAATALLRIGALNTGTLGNWFDGRLDEVAYYGSALSGTRIAAHYAAGFPTTTISGGHVTEVDAGRAGATTAGARVVGGRVVETDTGRAGSQTVGARVSGGIAHEADTPHAGSTATGQITAGGHVSESDTPHAGTPFLTLVGGTAHEADTAHAGGNAPTIVGGHVTETDAAHSGAIQVIIPGGIAHETDTAHGHGALSPTGGHVAEVVTLYPGTVVTSYGTVRRVRAGGRRRTGVASAEWSPAVVAVPVPFTHGQAVDLAQAFTVPVMVGTQPTYTITEKTATRHRDRIVVGGKDITYFRNIPTPTPSYQLVEPLTYGPATLELPQVAAPFETPGVGDLAWLKPGKRVLIQRVDVDTGEVVATDYRGIVIAFDTSGRSLTVEVGGEASGRAALRDWPLPIFRQVQDAGRWAWHSIHSLGLRFSPRLGPDTGIDLARFGGTGHLDYIRELCAKAQDRDGTQWTINRTENHGYKFQRKDTATIDGTVYLDDARCVGELRRDIAEEPNVIYGTGVTPEGMRWQGGAFPGLLDTDPAPYPFRDGRTFGLGTQDADTDTGDGITVMIAKLRVSRYVGAADSPGGYDRDIVRAVKALQDDAGLSETGVMNVATWNALYDLETTGPSLRWSHIAPIAQKSYTRQFLRSGSGAIMGRNPNYDPSRLPVHRSIDFGAGVKERQGREWARRELDQSEDNWVGTITLHGGAVVAGDHTPGDPITSILRARDITTGMNLRLPLFAGGIIVHVSAVSVSDTVTLTVDTRARDSLEVWEVIQRNRETRRDPARQWAQQHRASGEIKDSIDEWWEVGGLLGARKPLHGGRWNVFWVVAGQAGTVQKLALETNPNAEYAVAIFGDKISASTLDHTVGNPLTVAGRTKWDNESVRKRLDQSHLLLYAAGDKDSPCGYWPKQKILDTPFLHQKAADQKDIADIEANAASEGRALTDAENQQIAALNDEISDLNEKIAQAHAVTLTGAFKDEAGFSYYTQDLPVLWVAIYPDRNTSIPAGRVMWQQLEAGA